jgi:ribose transport system substrate-binding protein
MEAPERGYFASNALWEFYRYFLSLALTPAHFAVTIFFIERKSARGENAVRVAQGDSTVSGTARRLRRSVTLAALLVSTVLFGGVAHSDDIWQGPTTPAKAPKDIKVGVIPCGVQFRGCNAPALGAQEAAKALGWAVTAYDGAGTQEKQNTGMLDALSSGANLILTTSLDPNFIQLGLTKAKEAGVPVVSSSAGTDTPNPVITPTGGGLKYVTDVGTDFPAVGRGLGDFAVKDSGGKANVVVYEDDEYPSSVSSLRGFVDVIKKCPGCKVSDIVKMTASQIGSVGQMVVGYLQTHPDVDWVYAPYDPAAAVMVNAIVQAGLQDKVKLVSIVGSAQNIDFIRQGRVQVADGAYDNFYMGWAQVDQAIRTLNKQPLIEPNGEGTPFAIITKDNLPPPGGEFGTKVDYRSKFLSLWK